MAKGLKYLLSMLLLILGCSKKPKPEPEPSAIRRVSSTICDGETEVALWGDCTDLHSSVSDGIKNISNPTWPGGILQHPVVASSRKR